jgi:hypothetical protein
MYQLSFTCHINLAIIRKFQGNIGQIREIRNYYEVKFYAGIKTFKFYSCYLTACGNLRT